MKKIFFLLAFVFMACAINANAGGYVFSETFLQFDKSAMVQQKLKKAQACINSGQFATAQTLLRGVLKLSPNNSRAKAMLASCEEGVRNQNRKELQAYEDACSEGTPFALQSFISKYPKSEKVSDVKNRLQDYKLWNAASSRNTIDAYYDYLSESSMKAYRSEAYVAIDKLKEDNDWNTCKNGSNESLLSKFIANHPNSCHVKEAQYFLNVIRGEENYAKQYYYSAYEYLYKANSYRTLTGAPARHFQEMKQENEFKEAMASSDISLLSNYLYSLPTYSPYRTKVSNRLAILKASQLGSYSSESGMNEALAYAQDEETRSLVKNYIKRAKELHAYYEKSKRAAARRFWWRNRFTIGWNICHLDYLDDFMGLGTGIRTKFGRWDDVVNFTLGAEYAYIMYFNDDVDDDETYASVAHQIEVPIGFRLNLFEIWENTKFYIGCEGSFGFNLAEGDKFRGVLSKNNFSIAPQIGFASRRWDMGFYYKKYVNGMPLFKNFPCEKSQRIGYFLTYYF